ncbi:uncharacterized protein DMAD_00689 [Drosophila madeirensis]|uniref:Uncharacterized protein n=1 Tax=Drosophila madeirensis TaxID=30013 RepID=A0AAU9FX71_DROMD
MDCFQVPKVVNIHVLKAIYFFSECVLLDYIPSSSIKLEVAYTIRNANPVQNLDAAIESSLKNFSLLGILKETVTGSDEKLYELQLKPSNGT